MPGRTGPVPSPDNPHEAIPTLCAFFTSNQHFGGLRGEGVISAMGDGGAHEATWQ